VNPPRRRFVVVAAVVVVSVSALAGIGGCASRPSLIPNSDPALRKTSAEFAADAKKRHPFNAALPAGGTAKGRAQVGYGRDTVELVNLGTEDWHNVELWANRKYVVFIPFVKAGAERVTTINFEMMFDEKGHYFPVDNSVPERMVRQLEIVRDGMIYTVPFKQAD
jgi:hypothetical protein